MPKPSQAVFDALFRLVDETSAAHVRSRTDIPAQTLSRWSGIRREGGSPSFNADSFDALMKLDEVRTAAVAFLRKLPDSDVSAWEGIAAKLAEVISPAVGWRLAALMHELAELGLLDSELSVIAGIPKGSKGASHERAKADKSASRKAKAPTTK